MTDLPIPASAIEAAARAMWEDYQDKTTAEEQVAHEEEAEDVLRAAFDELGMELVTEEKRNPECLAYEPRQYHQQYRSRWMPVEGS